PQHRQTVAFQRAGGAAVQRHRLRPLLAIAGHTHPTSGLHLQYLTETAALFADRQLQTTGPYANTLGEIQRNARTLRIPMLIEHPALPRCQRRRHVDCAGHAAGGRNQYQQQAGDMALQPIENVLVSSMNGAMASAMVSSISGAMSSAVNERCVHAISSVFVILEQ